MTPEELAAWQQARIAAEDGPRFLGIPDRWYESPGPKWRCTNGHVSHSYLKSEENGPVCLACFEPLVITFPEDEETRAKSA